MESLELNPIEEKVGQIVVNTTELTSISTYFFNSVSQEEILQRAETEVGEKEAWKTDDLKALRDLIKNEKELNEDILSDTDLLKFLRARSFDYENANELLKAYNKLHVTSPTLFIQPSLIENLYQHNLLTVLKRRTDCDETILIVKTGKWDPNKHSFDTLLAGYVLTLECITKDLISQITGLMIILDMAEFSWTHLRNFGPLQAKKLAYILEEALPIRIKGVHVVNDSMLTYLAYAVIKPFLSQELKSKIEFHKGNLHALHKMIPLEHLPIELGGIQGPFDGSEWYKCLLGSEKELLADWSKFGKSLFKDGSKNSGKDGPFTGFEQSESHMALPACGTYLTNLYKYK